MNTAVDDFSLIWSEINSLGFFEKNNQGNKTFLPQLHFFRNTVGKLEEMAKVLKIYFSKKTMGVPDLRCQRN